MIGRFDLDVNAEAQARLKRWDDEQEQQQWRMD